MQAAVPHQARFGPYLILRKLGEGAMAKVYLAQRADERGMREKVALKVLRREYSGKPEILSLLRREAVIGGKMRHPHVIGTLEFGEIDGLPYLAMEYVQGVTVADLLEMVEGQGRGLPAELVASLMIQVCDGLSYAHNLRGKEGALGVVHRDLKPGNVMVSLSGVAKVMDFGVAKIKMYGGDITTVHRTTRGTPAYMSPEQARGDHLTHHSDIFTAGLLLYELLTGSRPFTAESFNELLRKVREGELPSQSEEVEEASPGMGRIFRRATAVEPLRRYPDAGWMKEDLEQIYPADTPIPPPSFQGDQPDPSEPTSAAAGMVAPPPLNVPLETEPSAIVPEDTEDAPLGPESEQGEPEFRTARAPADEVALGTPIEDLVEPPPDDEVTHRTRLEDLVEPPLDDEVTHRTRIEDLEPDDPLGPAGAPAGVPTAASLRAAKRPSSSDEDGSTEYYIIRGSEEDGGPISAEVPAPTVRSAPPVHPGPPKPTASSTRYYSIPDSDDASSSDEHDAITRKVEGDRAHPGVRRRMITEAGSRSPVYELPADDDDETRYHVIAEEPVPLTASGDMPAALGTPSFSGEDLLEGEEEEIELDPETHNEVDLLDEDDISAIDLETLPELDLDDEMIPEVDLGPPVFLELRPKPDPDVPVSTDTLVHLTQFLIELNE